MTSNSGWRRYATFAAIDVLLVVTAGSAMAAPAAQATVSAAPVLPTLMLLGVGLCGLPFAWRTRA